MQGEHRYWFAVVRPHNLDALVASNGLESYAATEGQAGKVHTGDAIALYRTRGTGAPSGGIVAVFEVTGEPALDRAHAFSRLYQMRIPWRPLVACPQSPFSVKPLVGELRFITNKQNYGSAFQRSWISISGADCDLITNALKEHAKSLGFADGKMAIENYRDDLRKRSIESSASMGLR